jgi:hypothetical protein
MARLAVRLKLFLLKKDATWLLPLVDWFIEWRVRRASGRFADPVEKLRWEWDLEASIDWAKANKLDPAGLDSKSPDLGQVQYMLALVGEQIRSSNGDNGVVFTDQQGDNIYEYAYNTGVLRGIESFLSKVTIESERRRAVETERNLSFIQRIVSLYPRHHKAEYRNEFMDFAADRLDDETNDVDKRLKLLSELASHIRSIVKLHVHRRNGRPRRRVE